MKFIQVLLVSVLMTSCANYGTERILPTRNGYNESLQNGDKTQLLLNIVRFRYNDLPYFFSVNNIISQINYSNTFTGGVNNTFTPSPVNFSTSGSDSVTVGEAPTITYTPIQGDAFIRKMMTPVDLRILYIILHNSDADLGRVLRIFTMQVGKFDNIGVQQGTSLSVAHDFREMTELLSKLIASRDMDLESELIDGKFVILMKLKNFSKLPVKEQKILKKLGFSAHNKSVWMAQAKGASVALPGQAGKPNQPNAANTTSAPTGTFAAAVNNAIPTKSEETLASQPSAYASLEGGSKLMPVPAFKSAKPSEKPKTILVVQMRTLFMVLSYLSKGVHVPPSEVRHTITAGTTLKNGKLLNWQYFAAGIFDVHICKKRPKENVFLAVQYRNRWYYIRDDDFPSKSTFYLAAILMNLYEGNVQSGLTPFYSIIT